MHVFYFWIESKVRQSVEQGLCHDFHFGACQMHAQTTMRSKGKGHVLTRRSHDVEFFGALESRLDMNGGTDHDLDQRTSRDHDSLDIGVSRAYA
jgi:hypothetical protein